LSLHPPTRSSGDAGGVSGGESECEGAPAGGAAGGGDYSGRETTYRLCPNYASDINSPLR